MIVIIIFSSSCMLILIVTEPLKMVLTAVEVAVVNQKLFPNFLP